MIAVVASMAAFSPAAHATEWPLGSLDAAAGAEVAFDKARFVSVLDLDTEHEPVAVLGISADGALDPIDREARELTSPGLTLRLLNHDGYNGI